MGQVVIENDDFTPIHSGGAIASPLCKKKCDGNDYAYEIVQNKFPNGETYFTAGVTCAYFDETTNTRVPYYQYFSDAVWTTFQNTSNPYEDLEIISFLKSDMGINFSVFNSNGVGINTNQVRGVEKTVESKKGNQLDMKEYQGAITSIFASAQPCNISLSDYNFIFNNYVMNIPSTLNPLECFSNPNNWTWNGTSPVFGGDPTNHGQNGNNYGDGVIFEWVNKFWFKDWENGSHNFLYPGNGGILPVNKMKMALEAATDPNTGTISASEFIFFDIRKVGDPSFSLYLSASELLQSDNSLSLSGYAFSEGLYKMNVYFSNNVLYPVCFESFGSGSVATNSLSNYLITNLFPVPVTGTSFTAKFQGQKSMSFVYELYNSSGDLLDQKNFDIQNGEEIIYNVDADISNIAAGGLLVNKLTFEDGSTNTIQIIKSTY